MRFDPSAQFRKMQETARLFMDDRKMAAEFRRRPSKWLNVAHFWVVVGRNFVRNKCLLRASALAYTTILALIPMLAVMVIVSSSLLKQEGDEGIDRLIDHFIASVAPQLDANKKLTAKQEAEQARAEATRAAADASSATPPAADASADESATQPIDVSRQKAVEHIKSFIGNVDGGKLGFLAIISIILIAISLLSTIEKTFNDIWGVNRSRNFPNSVMRYWSTITLGPLCLIFVFALTSGPRFEATRNSLADMPLLGNFVMALMPFVILSLLFALFYLAVPNTKVDWRAALVGGAVGGCLWQMNHLFSVLYASKVVTNSQIYGSLSMLPLLLVGLFTSWLILLFGAQVAYNFQNRRTYMQEIQCENVDQDGREFIALRLMTLIGQRFETEQSPPSIQQIADRLDIPSRLVGRIIAPLKLAGLVMETSGGADTGHAPTRPIDRITTLEVLRALRNRGGDEMETREEPQREVVRDVYDRIRQSESDAASGTTLADLVARSERPDHSG